MSSPAFEGVFMAVTAAGWLRRPLRALAVVAVLAVAFGAVSAPAGAVPAQAERRVTVGSYNLYLGANLQPLFAATPATVATLAQQVWDHMQRVDFRLRAQAIARLIDQTGPQVVGLQEVALWERGGTPGALAPAVDFLPILIEALAARGDRYAAVSVSQNFQSPPVPLASGGFGRFTDRDVIIARADLPASQLKVSNPDDARYAAGLPLPNPLLAGAPIVRGWAAVDVKVRGKSFRLFDTHLEAFSAQVRTAQAGELAGLLSASPLPVILVGDLNSQPSDATGAYGLLTSSVGLADAWTVVRGLSGGNTSGQTDDLNLPESLIDHRIDYVLYQPTGLAAVAADVIGDEQGDRTPPLPDAPFGLWPSDHAGVVATLHLSRP
jgi:endonuclease/exonuclease/phosphatase family metal-dependent hydrolase